MVVFYEKGDKMYREFAYLYDEFMDNIPYEKWCENLLNVLHKYDITDGLICELGCGTGNMTELLYQSGYDMIGIDMSEDMLEVAREKLYDLEWEEEPPILYLEQDMRSFELFGTVRAVVSVCDSMNYLLEEEDLLKTFKLVNNYLDPSGLFIFDMKASALYEKLGQSTISDVREACAYIWDNDYDKEKMINTYVLTMFARDEEDASEDKRYIRSEELHRQRAYTIEAIKGLIEQAGMSFEGVLDTDTLEEPTDKTERYLFIAREMKQEGKLYV